MRSEIENCHNIRGSTSPEDDQDAGRLCFLFFDEVLIPSILSSGNTENSYLRDSIESTVLPSYMQEVAFVSQFNVAFFSPSLNLLVY